MQLGKLCKYAGDCPVYKKENKRIKKPFFLVRNVFCNRGYLGWSKCKRYELLEKGEAVPVDIIPND